MKFLLAVALLALHLAIAHSKAIQTTGDDVLADDADASLTVPEIITKYGYPVEVHNITTEDGYILEVHRIPYGKKCGPAENKRVIWLQHGMLGDSSNWIIAGTEKGLAYNFADECYDVWMGNFRGNTYGKNHVELHPIWNMKKFWSFSWHEMGIYDLPAFFDYVLSATGAEQIYYIGHSMGSTAFWVCMSEKPEYNEKIKLMAAMAPVAYMEHMQSPIRLIAPFAGSVDWITRMMGMYEFLPSNALMEFLGQTACNVESPVKLICSNVLFLVAGYNFDQFDEELMPTIMGHTPAGGSTRSIIHYAQGINSKKFRRFNHGYLGNMKEYGQPKPPEYDLSKITTPVAFFWGSNDWLAAEVDVAHLAFQLPNLVRNHHVEHDNYNHMDFLWAKDNIELINKHAIQLFNEH